jgi:PBP1b-binding outer membrane lipoprotein LpoB
MMTLSNLQSKIAVLAVALFLVGCQSAPPKRVETIVTVPPRYTTNVPIPKVQPTDLKEIKWRILNREEMQKFLATNPQNFIIYTLDEQNSAILIGNIQELRRYIQSQQEVIEYLKKVLDARTER